MEMCNGYKNYPTWAMALWLNNDYDTYSFFKRIACDLSAEDLADRIREAAEGNVDIIVEDLDSKKFFGVYQDVIRWAFEIIDWYEIAEGFKEDK